MLHLHLLPRRGNSKIQWGSLAFTAHIVSGCVYTDALKCKELLIHCFSTHQHSLIIITLLQIIPPRRRQRPARRRNKDNNQLVDLTVTTTSEEVAGFLSFLLFLVLFIIPIEKSYGNNNLINKGGLPPSWASSKKIREKIVGKGNLKKQTKQLYTRKGDT